MRHIDLPTGLSQHAIRHFLSTCSFEIGNNEDAISIGSPKGVFFAEPFALSMLAAFGDEAASKNVSITLETPSVLGLRYAKRMRLFDFLKVSYDQSVREQEEAGRFIPIARVSSPDDLKAFIAQLMPLWHLPEESAAAVSYCVSELVRNVLEHAGPSSAYVCAQYYEEKQRVEIGVADRGKGILSSLLRNYSNLRSDQEALVEALKPGVTGSKSFENAGAGLFFTKSLAKLSCSYFSIYSGNACYRVRKSSPDGQITLFADPLLDKHDLWGNLPYWPGTVVAVDINVGRLKQFRSTLAAIKQVYETGKQPKPKPKIHFS